MTLKFRQLLLIIGSIFVGFCWNPCSSAAVVLIASPESGFQNLTAEQAKMIWLGKTMTMPNGDPVKPVNLSTGQKGHKYFLEKVVEKSESQFKAYWSVKLFSGRGTPPQTVDSASELFEYLKKNPTSIGYIDSTDLKGNYKVLLRIP